MDDYLPAWSGRQLLLLFLSRSLLFLFFFGGNWILFLSVTRYDFFSPARGSHPWKPDFCLAADWSICFPSTGSLLARHVVAAAAAAVAAVDRQRGQNLWSGFDSWNSDKKASSLLPDVGIRIFFFFLKKYIWFDGGIPKLVRHGNFRMQLVDELFSVNLHIGWGTHSSTSSTAFFSCWSALW